MNQVICIQRVRCAAGWCHGGNNVRGLTRVEHIWIVAEGKRFIYQRNTWTTRKYWGFHCEFITKFIWPSVQISPAELSCFIVVMGKKCIVRLIQIWMFVTQMWCKDGGRELKSISKSVWMSEWMNEWWVMKEFYSINILNLVPWTFMYEKKHSQTILHVLVYHSNLTLLLLTLLEGSPHLTIPTFV